MPSKGSGDMHTELVDDFLGRALTRRQVLKSYFDAGHYADVVHDARTTMDMVVLASMVHSAMPTEPRYIADERLPDIAATHKLTGMSYFITKQARLSAMPLGAAVPGSYYTAADAQHAIDLTDKLLHMFVPHIRPQLANTLPPVEATVIAARASAHAPARAALSA